MSTEELLRILSEIPNRNVNLTSDQENIVRHPEGPGWVLAGPGSGKTEVLTILLLRLLYVENDPIQEARVPPEGIFVTTFTKKSARNLEDRLVTYRVHIVEAHPELEEVDISKLRLGTLHELCNDLLQEYRYPEYQNVRLMDEYEQAMLIYTHHSFVRSTDTEQDLPFWRSFDYLFMPHVWQNTKNYLPNRWARANALMKLFNRIIEDRISIQSMQGAGGQWSRLAEAYEEYAQILINNYRCDFSHIQKAFLDFLDHPLGRTFVNGDSNERNSGIRWVLVDEYQDTNLIQERIYMKLAEDNPHNIVVVGDDDQALYRFRGGSVECMVNFDEACNTFLQVAPSEISRYPLVNNFRSHPRIVDFINDYITSFPIMNSPGSRVPDKPNLISSGSIAGDYPAVGTLEGNTGAIADRFASTLIGLLDNGIIQDYNQCCLLLTSTKESPRNAGPYIDALRNNGLSAYNPRNKAFLEQEEVGAMMGALIEILDPGSQNCPQSPREINNTVQSWLNCYQSQANQHEELSIYVTSSRHRLNQASLGAYLSASLLDIVYYILSLPPFSGWQNDPTRRRRLARLTAILEAFQATPVTGRPGLSRGIIRLSETNQGEINSGWLGTFYHLPIGYLVIRGADDVEDEEVICPSGMVPVMTIHQSKGLEFPFVFVGDSNSLARISDSHHLEDALGQFPIDPQRSFTRPGSNDRANLDLIRQFYVAYSRAQYALIIMGTRSQLRQGRIPCGPTRDWLRQQVLPL